MSSRVARSLTGSARSSRHAGQENSRTTCVSPGAVGIVSLADSVGSSTVPHLAQVVFTVATMPPA
jgi:hypothetical protein